MTERGLAQLPLLSREIEQVQARLQGADLDPAAYCQSVRHVVVEHRQWVEELLERRIAERDRLEGFIAAIEDEQAQLILAYRFAAGTPWKAVAARLGGGLTAVECSKIAGRYLEREEPWPPPDRGIYDSGKYPGRNYAEISCRGLFSSCRMSPPI